MYTGQRPKRRMRRSPQSTPEVSRSSVEQTPTTSAARARTSASCSRAGIAVPPGFALSADAYRIFVDEAGLEGTIAAALARARPDDVDCARGGLEGDRRGDAPGAAPRLRRGEVAEGYEELARVTGRCRATGGRALERARGGQRGRVVCRPAGELSLGARCRARLATPCATAGRASSPPRRSAIASRSGPAQEAAMGVTVQAMVDAEVSGVLFTCNPVSGDPSMVAVNASWGLGIGVVGGELTPDDYLVSKITGEVVRRDREHEARRVRPRPCGAGHGSPGGARRAPRRAVPGRRGARRAGRGRATHRAPLRSSSGRGVGDRTFAARCRRLCSSSRRVR